MPRVRLTKEELDRRASVIRQLAAEGVSRKDITVQAGVHWRDVILVLGPSKRPVTADKVAYALELAKEQCPPAEIARSIGVSRSWVCDNIDTQATQQSGVEYREMMKQLDRL